MQLQLCPAALGSSSLEEPHRGEDAEGGDEKVLGQVGQLVVELPRHRVHPLGQPHVCLQAAAEGEGKGGKDRE